MVLGALLVLRRDRRRGVLILAPVAVYAAVLSANPDGGWMRYLLGCFPGLALLVSEAMNLLTRDRGRWLSILLGAALLAPGFLGSSRYVQELIRPDTRTLAEAWMQDNIPQGSSVLMDLPHTGPRLLMDKAQVEELRGKTEAAGSPRARLYRAMAQTHPGGGYRVLRIRRSSRDLYTAPRLVAQSQEDSASVDVRAGLGAARAEGVDYIVTSSFGARPERATELGAFFAQLETGADLLNIFDMEPGRTFGPSLRIYRLRRDAPGPGGIGRKSLKKPK